MTNCLWTLRVRKSAILLAVAAAVLQSGFAARADELAKEGRYTVQYTATNPAPMKPFAIGNNREMLVTNAVMWAINESGGGFLHDMTGRCSGWVIIDTAAGAFESHGYCNYSDKDGDQMFEQYDWPMQTRGSSTSGTGKWIGGTGKFAGLQGNITLKGRSLKSAVDGISQGAGQKSGTYKIVTASAQK
jgi:hypothetical protein